MEKLKELKFSETLALSWWALKLWFKNDWKGMVGYVAIDSIDNLLAVVKGIVIGTVVTLLTAMVGKEPSPQAVFQVISIYGIYYVINQFVDQISLYMSIRVNKIQDLWLDRLFASKNQSLEPGDVLRHSVTTMKMFADDGKSAFSQVVSVASSLVSYVVTLVSAFAVLFHYQLWLAGPIALFTAIPLIFISGKRTKALWTLNYESSEGRKRSREALGSLMSVGSAHKEIHHTGSAKIFEQIGFGFTSWMLQKIMGIHRDWLKARLLFDFIEVGALFVLLLLYGIPFVTAGKIGLFVTLIEVFNNVRGALVNFANNTAKISDIAPYVNMFRKYIEYESPRVFSGTISQPLTHAPKIELRNVSFTYPDTDKEVLHNISLIIESGQKVAFVGENGAGKTTLLHLLSGLYKPTAGEILVDGRSLYSLRQSDWYSALGFLLQNYGTYPYLSVREYLKTGNAEFTLSDEELEKILARADALDFVQKFPNKLDQVLSSQYKGGIAPSTGQSQKLAIAKLFYRNPYVVLFDEPTASIDAESEFRIFNEIYEFFKGKTVMIVSHRFSTVRNADTIYVLSQGSIVESGTHLDLVEKKGVYSQAYEKQAVGYR